MNDHQDEKKSALTDEEQKIASLVAELKGDRNDNVRYTKKYLESKKIFINRGGILKINGVLYATVKSETTKKSTQLGKGGNGVIKLIKNLETGTLHVIKVFNKEKFQQGSLGRVEEEAKVLALLGRGGGSVIKKLGESTKPGAQSFCVMQNYVPGKELFYVLCEDKTLTVSDQFNIALQAFREVKKLHDKGYIHRDIKPENFLWDSKTKKLTLVDFDLVQPIDSEHQQASDGKGTRGYMPPESYGDYCPDLSYDVYALARIIQDVFGIYENAGFDDKGRLIKFGDFPHQPQGLSANTLEYTSLRKLVTNMLRSTLASRIKFDDALASLEDIRRCYAACEDLTAQNKQDEIIKKNQPEIGRIIAQLNAIDCSEYPDLAGWKWDFITNLRKAAANGCV